MGLLVASVLGFMEGFSWTFALFSHFRVHYLIAAVALLIGAILLKRTLAARFAGALLLLNLVTIAHGLSFTQDRIEVSSPSHLKILSANVHSANLDSSKLKELVARTDPDTIILFEVNNRWKNELENMSTQYPFSTGNIREDNFGILLLSRWRLTNSRIEEFPDGIPFVEARVATSSIRVLGVHLIPPIWSEYTIRGDEQLTGLANKLNEDSLPTVVVGDFNNTPWAGSFQKFLMNSSSELAGIDLMKPTWPVSPSIFGLHLDHAVVKNLVVNDFEVLDSIGSDHRPIFVTLSTQKAGT